VSELGKVSREIQIAGQVKAHIAALTDDSQTIRDTLEGETDLEGLIRKVTLAVGEAEAHVASLRDLISQYGQRREQIEAQIEALRNLIVKAMELGEWKTLKLDVATLSVRPVAPKLQITDETQIPPGFWRTPDPQIDCKSLLETLKKGPVPGASLSNGGVTVSIRRA
jgi:hypothetical protein